MKIIDFDTMFFEYARSWVAKHPGLTEDQIEESYNIIMDEWIASPADWLEGACPESYFDQYKTADELMELLEGYAAQEINLPEPLYKRIVDMGTACLPRLMDILTDDTRPESLRAEVMGLIRDAGLLDADEVLEDMVANAESRDELSDMAADILSTRGAKTAKRLMDRFELTQPYGQDLILDICCNFPGDERIFQQLIYRLRNRPDEYARWAASLQKLGDPRAYEALLQILQLSELRYLDYLEVSAAIEALGFDVGEPRDFYGDPDFEALRML